MSTFRITGLRASSADLDQLRKAGLKVRLRGPHTEVHNSIELSDGAAVPAVLVACRVCHEPTWQPAGLCELRQAIQTARTT